MNDNTNAAETPPAAEPGAATPLNASAPAQDAEVTLIQPTAVSGTTPARLLEDAVVQLRKLGELREQEAKRNELLIAEMRDHVRRHARLSRTMLWLGASAVLLLAVLGIGVNKLRQDQNRTERSVLATAATVDGLKGTVSDASTEAAARLGEVAAALGQNSAKLGDVEAGLGNKVEVSLQAVRDERDAVRDTVRQSMDGHTRDMVDREMQLRDEKLRVAQEAERAREERVRVIQDAIAKLSAMAELPPPDTAVAPAAEAPAPEAEAVPTPTPEAAPGAPPAEAPAAGPQGDVL